MPSFQCPIPKNMNLATANGFMLSITKLPGIEFFCTEVNIPGISLPAIRTNFPLSTVPIPGDIMTFEPLRLTFLITDDFANYQAIFDWMIGLGCPSDSEQYNSFLRNQTQPNYSNLAKGYSDGFVQPLTSQNNAIKTFHFIDMFPTDLNQIQLTTTYSDETYIGGEATFEYNYFLLTT